MEPIRLTPAYDKTIWAGHTLTDLRNVDCKEYGASWEISAHPHMQNMVLNEQYKGMNFLEFINTYKEETIGDFTIDQMLRAGYLDTVDSLSIQVHPGDEYARMHENDNGKTECWYIIDAAPGATLIAGTTIDDKEKIKAAVLDGTLEQYVIKHPVKKGDFVFIDATMIHALGANIFAYEVGGNSNTTYRFYDFNRVDASGNKRELHVDKSFDVVDLSKQTKVISSPVVDIKETMKKELARCPDFICELYDIKNEFVFDTNNKTFMTIAFLDADATLIHEGKEIVVHKTDSIFIPITCGNFTIKTTGRIIVGKKNI